MCAGGVREESVPQPAQPVREAAAPPALAAHRLLLGHRAAVLRAPGGEDTHRDADKGHAAVRQQLQLAVHAHPVGVKATRLLLQSSDLVFV